MKRVTLTAAAIVLAVLAMLATRVAAQDTNTQERTFMTFSGAVEMPGVTLPAGTYVFRLADTPTRNVVQVLSKDEKDILGQWTFVQAPRPRATDDTVVMFKENKEGAMPAVQYWYYPGETIGKEFIYPKDQAQKIANRTGQSVLSDDGRIASSVSSTDSQGQVTTWQRENSGNVAAADSTLRDAPAPSQPTAAAGSLTGVRGPTPVAESDTRAQANLDADARAVNTDNRAVGTSGSADAQAVDTNRAESTQARAELPRTASPAPLVGLIGLLSLAAALGTRKLAAARQ
jgi:hypothetical protein